MPASKRKTVAEKLISIVSKEAAKIPDYRKRVGPDSISLHDAIMSGLAVMHLKKPSLLQFDRDCVKKPDKLRNMKSLYGVSRVPCDTCLREMLDPFLPLFSVLAASDNLSISMKGTLLLLMEPDIFAPVKSAARSAV